MIKIIFIITLFTICIGFCCLNSYPDNDLWARLIAGEHIVEKLSVIKNEQRFSLLIFIINSQNNTDQPARASAYFAVFMNFF